MTGIVQTSSEALGPELCCSLAERSIHWVVVVIPTDHPKLMRNRCVIHVFDGVFVFVTSLF